MEALVFVMPLHSVIKNVFQSSPCCEAVTYIVKAGLQDLLVAVCF